jgi:hypothetical protein
VTLHEQLDVLQFVTKQTTSDVVRDLLDRYVLSHSDLLTAVAKTREDANRVWTQAEIDAQERGQLENDEEAAKPENNPDWLEED